MMLVVFCSFYFHWEVPAVCDAGILGEELVYGYNPPRLLSDPLPTLHLIMFIFLKAIIQYLKMHKNENLEITPHTCLDRTDYRKQLGQRFQTDSRTWSLPGLCSTGYCQCQCGDRPLNMQGSPGQHWYQVAQSVLPPQTSLMTAHMCSGLISAFLSFNVFIWDKIFLFFIQFPMISFLDFWW